MPTSIAAMKSLYMPSVWSGFYGFQHRLHDNNDNLINCLHDTWLHTFVFVHKEHFQWFGCCFFAFLIIQWGGKLYHLQYTTKTCCALLDYLLCTLYDVRGVVAWWLVRWMPGWELWDDCVVYLGKTLNTCSASLQLGVLVGISGLLGKNPDKMLGVTCDGLASHQRE